MNIFIATLLFFAFLGLLDRLLGGPMGLSVAFDDGLKTMGDLCLSMAGIYCIAITALNAHPDIFSNLSQILPFDPSLIFGVLLAPDMGGFATSVKTAADTSTGLYSGLLVSSTLGCLISFVLPISLGTITQKEVSSFMRGVLYGIIALPVGLFVGGILLQMNIKTLIRNLLPILLLCIFLALALFFAARICLKLFSLLGQAVRILSIVLFVILAAGVFVPSVSLVSDDLIYEALTIALRISLVVCGSMVASHLILTRKRELLIRLGSLLGINEYGAVGLFLSLATSISMLPLYSKMDSRGKAVNAAFTVSGAFVLGGQLAFVSSVAPSYSVAAYMVCKLLGGAAGIALTLLFTPSEKESCSPVCEQKH